MSDTITVTDIQMITLNVKQNEKQNIANKRFQFKARL